MPEWYTQMRDVEGNNAIRTSSYYATFFFSSFSNSYGEYDMFKIFQRWRE